MPADLTNPFGPSCCEAGECDIDDTSTQPCGCDNGANYMCEEHKLKPKNSVCSYCLEDLPHSTHNYD